MTACVEGEIIDGGPGIFPGPVTRHTAYVIVRNTANTTRTVKWRAAEGFAGGSGQPFSWRFKQTYRLRVDGNRSHVEKLWSNRTVDDCVGHRGRATYGKSGKFSRVSTASTCQSIT